MTILISNALEPIDSGMFFTGYALVLFVGTIIRLGVEDQILLIASKENQNINTLFLNVKRLLFTPIVLGFSWAIIVLVIRYYGGFDEIAYVFSLLPIIMLFSTVIAIVFQGQGNYIISILGLSFLMPFTFIVLLLINLGDVDLIEVAYYILFAALINLFVMIFILGFKIKSQKIKVSDEGLLGNENLDINYAINSFVAVFFVQGPIFISGFMLPSENVTDVALASRLSQTLTLLLLVVNFTFAPVARRLFEKRLILELILLWKNKCQLLWALGAIISVLFWLIVHDSIYFIKYVSVDSSVLLILWISQIISISFGPIGFLMLMSNQVKSLANIGIVVIVSLLMWLLILNRWMTVDLYCGLFLIAILFMRSTQVFFAINRLRSL